MENRLLVYLFCALCEKFIWTCNSPSWFRRSCISVYHIVNESRRGLPFSRQVCQYHFPLFYLAYNWLIFLFFSEHSGLFSGVGGVGLLLVHLLSDNVSNLVGWRVSYSHLYYLFFPLLFGWNLCLIEWAWCHEQFLSIIKPFKLMRCEFLYCFCDVSSWYFPFCWNDDCNWNDCVYTKLPSKTIHGYAYVMTYMWGLVLNLALLNFRVNCLDYLTPCNFVFHNPF